METNTIDLLDSITTIRKKHNEIAEATGENFNIFSVLNLQNSEVGLHSRLIGELLNPKGSHNQGGIFLKLFLQETLKENDLKEYSETEIKNATVVVEENIGNIVDDYDKGGRIDLVIKFHNNKKEIVIENKIWADDQPKQLWRYKTHYPTAHLIYLTPFKKKPKDFSLHEIKIEDVRCITYHIEIIKWIENCIKEVSNLPLIREVLNHYLNIVNQITNQSNKKMEKEMIDAILKEPRRIDSAAAIASGITQILSAAVNIMGENLKKESELLELNFDGDCYDKGIAEYYFHTKKYSVCLDLSDNYATAYLGVYPINEYTLSDDEKIQIKNILSAMNFGNNLNFNEWIWVTHLDIWGNKSWSEVVKVEFAEEIISYVNRIMKALE